MNHLTKLQVLLVLQLTLVSSALWAQKVPDNKKAAQEERVFRFSAQHRLKVTGLEGAKRVDIWFWLPMNTQVQKVLDLKFLTKPEQTRVVKDGIGNRYLAAQVDNPSGDLELATSFQIERVKHQVELLGNDVGLLNEGQKILFDKYLRLDPSTGFHITPNVLEEAEKEQVATGDDAVDRMHSIFEWVCRRTKHYRNPLAPEALKSSGEGSADYCLQNSGGGCTDQHSLIIGWARNGGIPSRILFGSRLPAQEGEATKAGYRCIVEYFMPGYGWLQLDASQASNNAASFIDQDLAITDESAWMREIDRYFSGLDDIKRISFYRGRNLPLIGYDGEETLPLELFIHAYVVVDGKPHQEFVTTLEYNSDQGNVEEATP